MKTFWLAISGVGIVVAAVFMWRREFDRAFIAAALGLVAWFLNYRVQMRQITAAADGQQPTSEGNKGDDEDDEE